MTSFAASMACATVISVVSSVIASGACIGASARSASRIARAHLRQNIRVAAIFVGFQPPAPGARLGACGDEQLDLGIRTDDRADVAPIQNRTTLAPGKIALKRHQRRAHLWQYGHAAGGLSRIQAAQTVARQIVRRQVARGQDRITALHAHGAIQQARIQMREAEFARNWRG